jgi:hypothetical protein
MEFLRRFLDAPWFSADTSSFSIRYEELECHPEGDGTGHGWTETPRITESCHV